MEPRYGLDRLSRLAAEKDRGFAPSVFAEMLARFSRLRREEFELDEARYGQLRGDVERWRAHALELARGWEIERDVGTISESSAESATRIDHRRTATRSRR